jgi:glycosyltransferase involved in cell wall biosynthesis
MMIFHGHPGILVISTFPPRKCGIATFSRDLIHAVIPELKESATISICTLDKKENAALYGHPVTMLMDGYDIDSCIDTAARINRDKSIQLVCIEHEFGLYGGEMGDFLLGFLTLLEKPFIIRLHTVLPAPEPKRLNMVQAIARLANKVIVMTNHSATLLKEDYQVPPEKIAQIPHGTHGNSPVSAVELKRKYNLEDKLVLTTFGLLSPNKGIEKGINAMKKISAAFPDAIYLVLGETHPNLLMQEGEKYRNYLQQLIIENGLQENVRLINEYTSTKKLMEYLTLTDIYLFTSKDPNQAVSGTFLYAMSAGCPIISNAFVLAKEMLDKETGIILQTGEESELAEKAIYLLKNDTLRKEMGHNAFRKTRNTTWKKVAESHIGLFGEILERKRYTPESSTQFISK